MEKTIKILVIIGVAISLGLVMAIVGVGLLLAVRGAVPSEDVRTWVASALGFIFALVPGILNKLLEAWLEKWRKL